MNYNRVIQVGRLVRDPETKFVGNDVCLCKFTIANSHKYKSNDEWKEEPCFIDCEAWGRNAENIGQYLTKCSAILVEGRLKLNQWETAEGDKRSKIVVVVDKQQFLDGGKKHEHAMPLVSGESCLPDDDEPPF